MTRHFLIHAPGAPALERWRKAFPHEALTPDAGEIDSGRLEGDDTVWVDARRADWEDCVRRFCQTGCRVAVLSAAPASAEAARALDLGARAYSHVFATPAQFGEIALVLRHGGLWLGPDLMQRVISVAARIAPSDEGGDLLARLSLRERDVARLVAAGMSNKAVAARLDITERTVKAHLGAIFEKLGMRDRVQLALRLAGQLREEAREVSA